MVPSAVRLVFAASLLVASGCLDFEDRDHLLGQCLDSASGRYVPCAPDGGLAEAGPLDAATGRDAMAPDVADAEAQDAIGDDAEARDADPLDAGEADADEGDADTRDADPLDTGALDAGAPDALPSDSGPPDVGPPDAGLVTVTLQPSGPGRLDAPDFNQRCAAACSFDVPAGTALLVLASPLPSGELDTWTQPASCVGAGANCTVMVASSAVTIGADFRLRRYALTTQISASGTGTGVILGPAGIDCPTTCSANIEHGTAVELVAHGDPGSRFVRWLGDCTGGNRTCSLTMSAARSVIAEFATVPALVTNGQAADLVLGQTTFTDSTALTPVTGSALAFPTDCTTAGNSLWVSDTQNNRVLGWLGPPTLSGQSADVPIGQTSLVLNTLHPRGRGSVTPTALFSDGTRLLVGDARRLLVWNTLPALPGVQPDRFLGQASWTSNVAPTANNTSFSPRSTLVGPTELMIADSVTSRIMVWRPEPSGSGLAPASDVLGQPNLTSSAVPNPPTAASLEGPQDIAFHPSSGYLAVADLLNHRILVWTSMPTGSGVPADIILGQTSPAAQQENAGLQTTNAVGMGSPLAVHFTTDSLVVADRGNARLMIWTPIPTRTGAPATAVIGAPDLVTAPRFRATATTFIEPRGICQLGSSLYVVDSPANRVLRFSLARP